MFGEVLDGFDVLDKMEETPTDTNDRPLIDIFISDIHVFENPFEKENYEKHLQEKQSVQQKEKKIEEEKNERGQWFSNPSNSFFQSSTNDQKIGKYIQKNQKTNPSNKTSLFNFGKISNDKNSKKDSFNNRFNNF